MCQEKGMGLESRYEYLRSMKQRYRQARRGEKSRLLTEMEQVTGLHRKHLIARMNGPGPYRKRGRTRERGRQYRLEVEWAIHVIADTLDWICAERLKPVLAEMVCHLAKFGEMEVSPELLGQLGKISIPTVRRIMKRARRPRSSIPRQRRGRPPDTLVQARVPEGVISWQESEPGHFEVDFVIHGAPINGNKVVSTCQFIDVLTGWSERFAVDGHQFTDIWPMFLSFADRCPIPVREIHSDNGSEFLNHALISDYSRLGPNIHITRGRPGHKNDNRFVEQKNSSLIRAYLEHLHFDSPAHCRQLNLLYDDMWLYYNFFQPVLRQVSRRAVRRPDGTVRIVRHQDEAATPLKRLLRARPALSRAKADYLQSLHDSTNPRELRDAIHDRIRLLARLSRDAETLSIEVLR